MRASFSAEAGWRRPLDDAGLGLIGAIDVLRYDGLVPEGWRHAAVLPAARRAVVIAAGGRGLYEAYAVAGQARDGRADPLDRFVRAAVARACAALHDSGEQASALHYDEARDGAFADFVALGREAGLGWPSRLGLLIHADHGPWMSLRAIVLTTAEVASSGGLAGEGPCAGCEAPCVTRCHGGAVSARGGGFDVGRCAGTRRTEPACAERCDARRACPVGSASAYSASAEAHHMRASAAWLAD